jgi:hypothetical protein
LKSELATRGAPFRTLNRRPPRWFISFSQTRCVPPPVGACLRPCR